jgi:tetratricopeptide (TPR) repeat protein
MKTSGSARSSALARTIVFLALTAVAFAFVTPHARAQLPYAGNAAAFDDALDALSALEQAEDLYSRQVPQVFNPVCSTGGLSLDALGWSCQGEAAIQGYWSARPQYSIQPHRLDTYGAWVCQRSDAEACHARRTTLTFILHQSRPGFLAGNPRDYASGVQAGVDAMAFFARARSVRDPASDAEFLAALQAAPADSGQNETLRRVQVQAEAALGAGRTIDAARLFRDTLQTAPPWADGHYNLGLVYGELQLYPEAITEMRRYLHLTPNAADARAVQDQIYRWEGLMSERAP